MWRDAALIIAGGIGMMTALFHAFVMQRVMVRPLAKLLEQQSSLTTSAKRLVAPILHVSSVAWFTSGGALVIAGTYLDEQARLAICLLAGITYAYAALANAWGTRGRHPGLVLMAIAVVLIAAGR